AMMSGNSICSQGILQAFFQMMGYPFHQSARVDEHQSRLVLMNQSGQSIVDVAPNRIRRDSTQFVFRNFHRDVHFPALSAIDDGWTGTISGQKLGYRFDRTLRRGKADPDGLFTG